LYIYLIYFLSLFYSLVKNILTLPFTLFAAQFLQ